ncbi:hypothetical protein PseBG33_5139 [Pseudomonas synxantha BG33R]|nr:hypothetical protein PseBG33_5139 [Pseudomonas synxantha BG33R]
MLRINHRHIEHCIQLFNYPLLIGAKALREFGAAVNPARRYTADKPDC